MLKRTKITGLSQKLFKQIFYLLAFSILLIFVLFKSNEILIRVGNFLSILSPLWIGIAIAFVLNLLVKFFENKIFKSNKIPKKLKRVISIILSFVIIITVVTALIFLIFPQLTASIALLSKNIPQYTEKIYSFLYEIAGKIPFGELQKELLSLDWQSLLQTSTQFLSNTMASLFSITKNITSGVATIFIALIFSIYILASKESLINNLKACLYAFFSQKRADSLIHIGKLVNTTFSNFVSGQILEAIILGTLCFIGMTIFCFDFSVLISTLIGITALIPIFGAFIGAAIGAFILFLNSPLSALCFIFFIIILQQIEGNIIYPKVVGTSLGLSGLWVLFAITLFGSAYGIIGILLGIPLFSVFSTLFNEYIEKKLSQKRIKIL